MKIESLAEQGIDSLSNILKGGAPATINACMGVGVKSYLQLPSKDRVHIDELITTTMKFIETLKPQYPKVVEYVSKLDVTNVTSLMKLGTKLLRKKTTITMLKQYVEVYSNILNHPRRIKAIGAYMVCMMSNIDSTYKEAVVAAFELVFAVVQVLAFTDMRKNLGSIGENIQKHIMRPMYKELARKK